MMELSVVHVRGDSRSCHPQAPGPVLRGAALSYTHPGAAAPAVTGVTIEVRPGQLTAVLGPNGAGKSTLLRLLTGALRPQTGGVTLDHRSLDGLGDRERARILAVVPQSETSPFPVTVRELVSMGRYPHLGTWNRTTARDRDIVDRALEQCAVTGFADRQLDSLSGGERQRVRIARALAQEAPILLLDEPTAGLDLRYRMEIFHLLSELCSAGLSVLLITHDLNLAARFADQILLLDHGRPVVNGPPRKVLNREGLEPIYGWPLRFVPHPGPGADEGAPQAVALRRSPR